MLISAIDLLQFFAVCGTPAAVWSVLEQRVYRTTRIRDVSHFKVHLVEEWQKFDQKIVDWAITD